MTNTERQPWLDGIEGEEARAFILSEVPVICAVSGPGSGKTTCLKKRVMRLVERDGVPPSTIYVGTFTRAISGQLQEKLDSELNVSTLHSLALDLLKRNPAACQGMKLRFLLKYEEDVMLYDIEHENASVSFGHMRRRQDELKKMQASRSERLEYENAAFAGAVRRWLIRFKSMLIGEVVYLAVTGLESGDIQKGMFDHVVIDEYQDLTAAEQELVTLVWSESGSLTVMGDDDQSIYSFRYNHPSGISEFERSWPPEKFRKFEFVDNRRCGVKILRVANAMMAEAGSSKPPMKPKTRWLGSLDLVEWNTLDEEIAGLANYIKSRTDETFLVLVPRRYIGYRLSDAIGEDAQTAFMEEVLEHSIAKEAFTAVCLLANPDDWVAARVWLGFHGTEPKLVTGRNSVAFARLPKEIGGHELLREIAEGNVELSGNGQRNIRLRAKQAIEWIDQDLEPSEIVATFFNPARAVPEKNEEKRGWLETDLMELREAANEILSNQETQDLAGMVETLRYRIATRAPLKAISEDARVKIMTLHAAKGLDAKNVVVASVADQLTPGHDADDHEKAEEHRRLLYVAVTRAKENLVVSWPRFIRSDIMSNKKVFGRKDGRPWTIEDQPRYKTSRSRLLPQGLTGIVSGKDWLNDSV